SAEMLRPAMGADFTPVNGFVKIHFQGTVPAIADDADQPLLLKIYTNQGASNPPMLRFSPPITDRDQAKGQWTFAITPRLRLRPGVYYYILERSADEDMLFVGKFTVGRH
ncbi:MAG: hypothetical protein ABIO24_13670, partial [Saprospiraceae bacterium]